MTKMKNASYSVGDRRRSEILSSALKVFAENGYEGTSVQKIADVAGLTKTNVFYYFSNKKALYSAVMQSTLNMWNSSFDNATKDDCPAKSLANYISEKMERSRVHPYMSKAYAIEVINGYKNLDESFKQKHIDWVTGRVDVIREWVNEGKMDAVNPEFLIYNIWSSTQHYADFSSQITILRGAPLSEKDFREATATIVHIILKGCGLDIPEEYKFSPLAEAGQTRLRGS